MYLRPKFRPHAYMYPVNEKTWAGQGGEHDLWRFGLKNETASRAFSLIVAMLDGNHSLPDMEAALEKEGLPRQAAAMLLHKLDDAHLLEEGDLKTREDMPAAYLDEQVRFFSRFTSKGGEVFQNALGERHVAVIYHGSLTDVLLRHLLTAGITQLSVYFNQTTHPNTDPAFPLVPSTLLERAGNRFNTYQFTQGSFRFDPLEGEDLPDLLICPRTTYNPNFLEQLNAYLLEQGTPWLLVQSISSLEGLVGPFFVPQQTACYMCYEARLASNVPFFAEYEAFLKSLSEKNTQSFSGGTLFPFVEMLAGIATSEAIKYLTGYAPSALIGKMLSVNYKDWDTQYHDVLRLPRCATCRPVRDPIPFPWMDTYEKKVK